MSQRIGSLSLLAGGLLALASPARVFACSAPYCPAAAFAVPAGGTVPANFGELTVSPEEELVGSWSIKLFNANDPSQAILTTAANGATPNISLAAVLQPGASYLLEASPSCFGESVPSHERTLSFTVGRDESRAPESLGPLRLARSERGTVPIGGGAGCFEDFDASLVDLELTPDFVAEPWRNLLTNYQLMVDGQPFAWTLTIGTAYYGPKGQDAARGFYFHGPGTFRTFAMCDSGLERAGIGSTDKGIAPGKHEVWVQARVPTRVPSVIESDHIQIELSCSMPTEPREAGAEEGGEADADVASPADEPAPTADATATARERLPESADGCSTRPTRGGSVAFVVLLLAFSLMRLVWDRARRAPAATARRTSERV